MKIKSLTKIIGVVLLMAGITSEQAYCQETSTIEVKNVEVQKAITIKAEVMTSEIGPKMGELYGQLYAYIAKNNIQPSGTPFAVYYSFDPNGKTIFEVGFPVPIGTKGSDSIAYKEYPAMKVVSTLYQGSYENMGPVYEKLMGYMTANNLKSTGASWEVYLTDPKMMKDPNENKTLIYFPIE